MWIANLKNLKNRCKTTYIDISNACGVSKTKVCNWFNGVTMPDPGYIDIMYDKFFDELLYSADRLEALFSYAYDEKHNVDGQIGMCEVNWEEDDE